MIDQAYYNLAKVLDIFPNGFPATENGLEINNTGYVAKRRQITLDGGLGTKLAAVRAARKAEQTLE